MTKAVIGLWMGIALSHGRIRAVPRVDLRGERTSVQDSLESRCFPRDSTQVLQPVPRELHMDSSRWSPSVHAAVIRHKACVGMSRETLLRAWGMPRWIVSHSAGQVREEDFTYGSIVVHLRNARVVEIRSGSPR